MSKTNAELSTKLAEARKSIHYRIFSTIHPSAEIKLANTSRMMFCEPRKSACLLQALCGQGESENKMGLRGPLGNPKSSWLVFLLWSQTIEQKNNCYGCIQHIDFFPPKKPQFILQGVHFTSSEIKIMQDTLLNTLLLSMPN